MVYVFVLNYDVCVCVHVLALTEEFLHIYGKCPSKLQKKINEQIKLAQKQVGMNPLCGNWPMCASLMLIFFFGLYCNGRTLL